MSGYLRNFLELILSCIINDSATDWNELHQRYDRSITGFIRKSLRRYLTNCYGNISYSQELVSDLTQDVYVKLLDNDYQALRKFKGATEGSFLAYLSRISNNVVIEFLRKQLADKRNVNIVSYDSLLNNSDSDGNDKGYEKRYDNCFQFSSYQLQHREEPLINQLVLSELMAVLNNNFNSGLLRRDRTIFLLYSIYGYTPKQLAEMPELKVSYANVEVIIRRVRRQLLDSWTNNPLIAANNREVA